MEDAVVASCEPATGWNLHNPTSWLYLLTLLHNSLMYWCVAAQLRLSTSRVFQHVGNAYPFDKLLCSQESCSLHLHELVPAWTDMSRWVARHVHSTSARSSTVFFCAWWKYARLPNARPCQTSRSPCRDSCASAKDWPWCFTAASTNSCSGHHGESASLSLVSISLSYCVFLHVTYSFIYSLPFMSCARAIAYLYPHNRYRYNNMREIHLTIYTNMRMYAHVQYASVSLDSAVLSRMGSLSLRKLAAANSSLQNPAFKADLKSNIGGAWSKRMIKQNISNY